LKLPVVHSFVFYFSCPLWRGILMRPVVFFAAVSALLLASSSALAAESTPDHSQLLALVADPLPATVSLQKPPAFYDATNLFEYMDGAGDIFVQYGVRSLMHGELHSGAVDITLDVFDMASPDRAFGIYASERAPDEPWITIGAEGYANKGALNFVEGNYYIKLLGFGEGADPLLASVAHQVEQRLGSNSALPAILASLPAKSLMAHSATYIPTDPLGHAWLGPAYQASYKSGDHESKLLITLANDAADAEARLAQLRKNFASSGSVKELPEIAPNAVQATNSYEGTMLAAAKGSLLIVVVDPAADGAALLAFALASIQ